MGNAWRVQLRLLLDRQVAVRPPALRRSPLPDYLYATDLPGLCSPSALAACCQEAESLGWAWHVERGWLHLRRPAIAPPEGGFCGPFGPEAACCAQLLSRHAGKGGMLPSRWEEAAFALIKAGEEGPAAYERVCRALHQSFAECLRRGESLPPLSLSFFGRSPAS